MKKFISVSFAFTRIEHAIESIVNHGLTKYIYTSASITANSARRKSPGSRDRDIIPQYFYEYPMHKEREKERERVHFCPEVFAGIHALKERVSREEKNGEKMAKRPRGCVRTHGDGWLQTGRTSLRVSLSQTNGLRLFDAVFHRNLLFIIPPARDDIEPCLLVVALMSLIAPPVRTEPPTTGSRRNPKTSSSFLPPVPPRAVGARKFNSPFFSRPRVIPRSFGIKIELRKARKER